MREEKKIAKKTYKNILSKVFLYLASFIILVECLFPFYWAIISSLKDNAHQFTTNLWPQTLYFQNYIDVMKNQIFGYSFLNSVIVAFLTAFFTIFIATLAAYPLARKKFKGRKRILILSLWVTTLPHVAVLSGLFELIKCLDLYNSRSGLIFSYMLITTPFAIWIITNFMRAIPKELEEAAIMDGASTFTILVKVFLPLLAPSLITTTLLSFISAWNEFLFALSFTLTKNTRTVPVVLALFNGENQYETPWGLIMSASVLITIPLIILIVVFQRRILSGISAGALKG